MGTLAVDGGNEQAVRWTLAGGPVHLGLLPGGATSAGLGISANGQVVVGYGNTGTGSQAFRWSAATGMVSLRPVPGTWSEATATNADGSVVTGFMDANTAFRWTQSTGLVPLGSGRPHAISADGSVIVGGDGPGGAFIWTPQTGLMNLELFLLNTGASEVAPWTLDHATGISADGRVIVGYGTNPLGQVEGFYAVIPAPSALLALGGGLLAGSLRRRSRRG